MLQSCSRPRGRYRLGLLSVAGLLLAAAFWAGFPASVPSDLHAAPPPGKGGGGEKDTGGGTIYFVGRGADGSTLMSMNSDGTNKTTLPVNVSAKPSRLLHGERRWFLDFRRFTDETYPDGTARYEELAVRGDGDESFTVQLDGAGHGG